MFPADDGLSPAVFWTAKYSGISLVLKPFPDRPLQKCGRPIHTLSNPGLQLAPAIRAVRNQRQRRESSDTSSRVISSACCGQGGCHTRKNRLQPPAALKAV